MDSKLKTFWNKKNITLIAVLSGLIALFAFIAVITLTGAIYGMESGFYYDFLVEHRTPFLTGLMRTVVLKGMAPFLIGVALLFEIMPKTRHKFGFQAALAVGLSPLINIILKAMFNRPRPMDYIVHGTGSSFPSGHAFSAASFFVTAIIVVLLCVKDKRIKIPAVILLALCPFIASLSRVYLGAHYIGDTLAGMALGTALAITIYFIVWPFAGRIWDKITTRYPKIRWTYTVLFGKPKEENSAAAGVKN